MITSDAVQSYNRQDNVTLNCTASGGPGNTVQWRRNGITLPNETSYILEIFNISASQGGEYTCMVNNSAGIGSASVSINIRPEFTSQPQDLQAVVGSTEALRCEAEAFPSPQYQWVRIDGQNIRAGITTDSMLMFVPLMFGDEGLYFCNATSRGETIQSDIITLSSKNIATCSFTRFVVTIMLQLLQWPLCPQISKSIMQGKMPS